MTDQLYKMFCSRFPPIPETGTERVTTYMGVERIHLKLIDKAFFDTERVTDSKIVKNTAEKIFDDVEFRFYTLQEEGDVILFEPYGLDGYKQNYVGHAIEVLQRPRRSPVITFSTGNRGAIRLKDRQRKKYFDFAVELNDIFLKEAKSSNEKHK